MQSLDDVFTVIRNENLSGLSHSNSYRTGLVGSESAERANGNGKEQKEAALQIAPHHNEDELEAHSE